MVVKLADGFGSLGVIRVDEESGLSSAIRQSELARQVALGSNEGVDPRLVVEEYLDGPEYVVESLVVDGHVHVLAIGDKGYPQGPFFEAGNYVAPAQLDDEARNAIFREVIRGHRALGINMGPTHTELRLCEGNRPFILEVGARFGGSGVSHYIAQGVSGVDFAGEVMRMAVGLPPRNIDAKQDTLATPVGIAANYIVQSDGSGRIAEIVGLSDISVDPQVDHIIQMLHSGDVVRPYPHFSGYPAFVLSRHADHDSVFDLHERIGSTVRIVYEAD
ncbi:ATP-grasp domain-containing protein [Rhodococcus sp. ABRD24]|uniref:ATP-grasp domain-containing protein n=1 Tax=Rhodococcus sp. ABRD24 TaxID=2507582 RepID=UPI0013F14E71|nr:ATP-grasp domain-containing protein [Rhodococcus sp. ABRD24]